MIKQEHRFPKDSKVRIKPEVTGPEAGLYENACVGNEGWIRKRRLDKYGYPMVLIEWDRDHWTYNGEEDKWTFESHFDLIEENMTEKSNKSDRIKSLFAEFIQEHPELLEEEKEEVKEGEDSPDRENDTEYNEYMETLSEAFDAVAQADGYIIISVAREEQAGIPLLQPSVWQYHLTPESRLLSEFAAGQLAFEAFAAMSADRIRSFAPQKD